MPASISDTLSMVNMAGSERMRKCDRPLTVSSFQCDLFGSVNLSRMSTLKKITTSYIQRSNNDNINETVVFVTICRLGLHHNLRHVIIIIFDIKTNGRGACHTYFNTMCTYALSMCHGRKLITLIIRIRPYAWSGKTNRSEFLRSSRPHANNRDLFFFSPKRIHANHSADEMSLIYY